ncbi:MAG: hypothetical protein OJJ54_05015 [Pseudonocardia sp.]|nr:hypothetical protein [Pseudonocardia sp.]
MRMIVTNLVLLAPLLLLARRRHLPTGAATAVLTTAALLSGMLTGSWARWSSPGWPWT